MIKFTMLYFCFFCKIGNAIKKAWNAIVDALKEVADFFAELVEKVLQYIFDKILGPIIEKIIEPILRPIFELFSDVVKEIVSNVFMPLLKTLLETIVAPIVELVMNTISALFAFIRYWYMIGTLKFIDLLEKGFNIFSGVEDVTYRGTNDFLLNVFFKNNTINMVFWGITLLAVAMVIIFTIIAILQSIGDPEVKRPVGKILGASVKSIFILFIIPFVCLFVINLTSIMLRKTDDIVSLSQNGNKPSIGTLAFLTFTMDAAMDEKYNVNPSMTDGLRADYLSGKKTYFMNGLSDFSMIKINYPLAIWVSLIMAVILILCTLVFIMKIFEVLMLYIASPFFVATMVLDDGQKFHEWCEMFVAKLVTGFGMVVVMKLFFIIAPIIMASDIQFSTNGMVNTILKIVFLIGGLWSVYKSGNLITQAVNINAAYAEAGLTSDVVNRAVRATIKYGSMAAKAVATGGGSLATDLPNLALDAGKSLGNSVANAGDQSFGKKEAEKGESQAFKGSGDKGKEKPKSRGDSGGNNSSPQSGGSDGKSGSGSSPSSGGNKLSGGSGSGSSPLGGGSTGGVSGALGKK